MPMAAESAGLPDMVSGEEQPIDLSRTPRKPLRLMPPLIPIRLLRPGYNHKQTVRQDESARSDSTVRALPKLTKLVTEQRNDSYKEKSDQEWREKTVQEEDDEDEDEDEISRKRVRLENGQKGDGYENWQLQRLDRARSVPQLTPLHIPLQRYKSLSESRIPVATAATASEENLDWWLLEQHREEELRHLQMARALQTQHDTGTDNEALLKSSLIYVGYYSQLLHQFQTQEMLRQIALQHQRDSPDDQSSEDASLTIPKAVAPVDDVGDMKRRQARPLTGKHVRPGTGASPATLLTLRRKIQARQQQHDPKTLHK